MARTRKEAGSSGNTAPSNNGHSENTTPVTNEQLSQILQSLQAVTNLLQQQVQQAPAVH